LQSESDFTAFLPTKRLSTRGACRRFAWNSATELQIGRSRMTSPLGLLSLCTPDFRPTSSTNEKQNWPFLGSNPGWY